MAAERKGGAGSGRALVIVESPTKARKIAGYLGGGYVVESSYGHIRDLPNGAAEVPAKYKGESWARLGVDVDNGFVPLYVVAAEKKAQVKKLKDAMVGVDALYLATDEDREGEAIAWHLRELLAPTVPVHRMVFHEITERAIREAVENPRALDQQLVDAQETRRILDRLYGYEVSPVLWKKIMPRLSAGRVQSVATRLVVERERERMAFRAAAYWDLDGTFDTGRAPSGDDPTTVTAGLAAVDGRRVASGRDFSSIGELKTADVLHLDEAGARGLASRLESSSFSVRKVERKPYTRKPYAPFRTTTLQQEAARKLGFGAKRTMQVAQKLYENGFITYMRTDSTTLSEAAISAARLQATQLYGSEYVPETPRRYESKQRTAQEAHEAIRPAGETFLTPAQTGLSGEEFRLYELVWMRTVASQMKDATGQSVTVRIGGSSSSGEDVEFTASGKTITFHGFLKAYVEGADDPDAELDDREKRLPVLAEADPLSVLAMAVEGHETRPPARYTEASLVSELENRDIGRPSTYASIIGTILDRGYVFKKGTALVPAWLAFSVVGLLEKHFPHLVDYDFTARMEDVLDDIANGEAQMVDWLSRFYFGPPEGAATGVNGDGPSGPDVVTGLKKLVSEHIGDIDAREVNSVPIGEGIVVRVGRYGPYVERDGVDGLERGNIPEDMAPDELTVAKAEELFSAPSDDRLLGVDPEIGREILAKNGRYGPYVTEVLAEGSKDKPRTASLFASMSLDTVTLEEALSLLTLPRTLGSSGGEPVLASNGRYGPYVKRGGDTRSIAAEDQLLTITLDEALALLAQPKQRGRQAAASAPLKELGADSVSGKPMVVKDGRFGPYVTDGETNASLRKGDEIETLTDARASELLADRRARGPAKKAAREAPAKKTAAKKTAAKKTAAKTAAKKAVPKPAAATKAAAKP